MCGLDDFPEEVLAEPTEQMADVQYICADGGEIPNVGSKAVKGLTTEGAKMNVTFQVTQVARPLRSSLEAHRGGPQCEPQ